MSLLMYASPVTSLLHSLFQGFEDCLVFDDLLTKHNGNFGKYITNFQSYSRYTEIEEVVYGAL